jgi:hypothetical protein
MVDLKWQNVSHLFLCLFPWLPIMLNVFYILLIIHISFSGNSITLAHFAG